MFKGYTIVTDMDGTLLNSKGILTEENIKAIKEFTTNGGNFTVATGRMLASVEKFCDRLELNMPAILYNGSKIYDFSKNELIYEGYLEDERRDIIKKLAVDFPFLGIEVYIDEMVYIYRSCKYTNRLSISGLDHIFEIDDTLFDKKWTKVLLIGETDEMDIVEDHYKNIYKAGEATRSGNKFLEILPLSTSKGSGVEYLCKEFNLDRDKLITVGDAMNDVALLAVTKNGYCVANGAQRLKKIAKTLEVSNDEHIIRYLVDMIKEKEIIK